MQLQHESSNIIDVEKCFHAGVIPVISVDYKYLIKVNAQQLLIDEPQISGATILTKMGYTPDEYLLFQLTKKGKEKIDPNEIVDLTTCGVERFITIAKGVTNGKVPRRDFSVPEDDAIALNAQGFNWETVSENNMYWIILRNVSIPEGYLISQADLALQIPPGYPTSTLDMIYVYPSLAKLNGRSIPNTMDQSIEGKIYQCWSRHRDKHNAWKVGEDNILTQLSLMLESFITESKQ